MNAVHNSPPTSAETIAMADQLRSLCSIITKIARTDLQSRLESHNSGIGAIEQGVLRHLSRGVTSMKEISRLMGVAPSTLVYVVDGLAKKKLIKRGKDPKDRRREPLSLEKKGADLFASIPRMDATSVLVQSLESMKASDRRKLLLLLDQFAQKLPGSNRLYLRPEYSPAKSRPQPTVRAAQARRKTHGKVTVDPDRNIRGKLL